MDNVLVWAAVGFVVGALFVIMAVNSLFGRRPVTQPTVVVMEQNRSDTLADVGNGCASVIFMVMMMIGVVAALIVLGS